ncbi:Medium-chain fatty-acid--CoA ligase [Alphaproteobacteria bacterium SO-S41]|nr:Medium-chain fatty-acid--CoA ligase [Alphaproteobacteria bacterium SO-S41]
MSIVEAPLIYHTAPDGRSWYELGLYSADTLGRRIERNVAAWPDTTLLYLSKTRGYRTTLGAAVAESQRIASAFLDLGVKRGERIAVMLPSWHECLMCYLAGLHAGFIIVPMVTIFGVREVSFIMKNCNARVLVCPGVWKGKDFRPIAHEMLDAGLADKVVMVDDDVIDPRFESWTDFAARGKAPAEHGPNRPDDVCFILYTSGTTADPKGARHTHNTLGAEWESDCYTGEDHPVGLNMMPAGHTAGLLAMVRPFFTGEEAYVMDEWDRDVAVEAIATYKVTRSGGTPFHLAGMIESADAKHLSLASLQTYIIGATNVTPALVEAGLERGAKSCRCYGSTEHPTISAAKTADPDRQRAFTDGRLLRGITVRLVDDDGKDVAPGEEGEIWSNGPELIVGYTDPVKNADSFVDNIWFKTGDVGRLDKDGYLSITDRKKDIIIRGGENISSREVEEALFQHPAVSEVAVVPLPDKVMGEKVLAFIVLNDGAKSFTVADALTYFQQIGMAKQKTPERVEIIGEMPRTPIGKIRKQDLKAIAKKFVA